LHPRPKNFLCVALTCADERVDASLAQAMQQGRLAKKLTQRQLATVRRTVHIPLSLSCIFAIRELSWVISTDDQREA
jgi:hypothetical protein